MPWISSQLVLGCRVEAAVAITASMPDQFPGLPRCEVMSSLDRNHCRLTFVVFGYESRCLIP